MNVKERLKKYIKHQNITQSEFEKSINASNGYVNSITKSIGLDKLEKILENYSNLNLYWLLTGQGEMLRKEDSDPKDHIPDVGDMVSLEEYKAQVKAATRLEIQLEQCQERVKALEKTVDQLKSAGSGVGKRELKEKD